MSETEDNSPEPPARPAPPPFRHNRELIGYIEKGQKPVRPAPASEKASSILRFLKRRWCLE